MRNSDLVSIIVPVYKGEQFINMCIDRLLSQTYPDNEIIVVYDDSPDNSLRILEEYVPKINLIKQKKTSPAIARNVGLRYANGKYIAFCDIDDFFAPNKIEKQVEVLEENPNIGLAYTDIVKVNHNRDEMGRTLCPDWDKEYWLSHRFIAFSSVLLRKDILDKIKEKDGYYFDENLPAFDDFDFLIRISKETQFKRIPDFLTYLRFHSENLSKDLCKMDVVRARIQWKHKLIRHWANSVIFAIPKQYLIDTTLIHLKRAWNKIKKL